jgi:four helix bundle protein
MGGDDRRDVTPGRVRTHRDLIVWQKAMNLAVLTYNLGKRFPSTETYGLTSQLQRAVTSVPMNIAEGHGRGTRKDYAQFLSIARGSLMETTTCIELGIMLGYISQDDADPALALTAEILKMINSIRWKLRSLPKNS